MGHEDHGAPLAICYAVNDHEGYEISLEIRELERHYDEVSRKLALLDPPIDETLNKPATLEMEI